MSEANPNRSPRPFDDLPEPARARAVQFFEELVAEGRAEEEADRQARELADKWMRERAPG